MVQGLKKLGQAIHIASNIESNLKNFNSPPIKESKLNNFNTNFGNDLSKKSSLRQPKSGNNGKGSRFNCVDFQVNPLKENHIKGHFLSTYTRNANAYLNTPVRDENTRTNFETDLHYDSETCEVSFSNEKTEKYRRRRKAPVILTSRILKY